jgi:hypothetical protein
MSDATRRAILRKLPAVGIALPFCLALLAHFAGAKPAPVAAAPARPALAFHQFLVDLGRVSASEAVLAYFDFTNRGSKDVEITGLEASCGCLQPHLKKKVYQPGESGFFTLKIQTANQAAGRKEYTVTVRYNDPAPQEAQVMLRVELPDDLVLVRPIALWFYQLGNEPSEEEPSQDASTSITRMGIKPQDFEITDRRGRHLNIRRIECSRDEVSVQRGDEEVDEVGTWHGRFRVQIEGALPSGHREAVVRIFTDDPDDRYRVLRVPIIMQGPAPRKHIDRQVRQASGTADRAAR